MMPINGEDFNNTTNHQIHHESTMPTMSKAEQRKCNKPIMEKRRRARINNCLNELKTLILEALKKDPARHTKLEKADILEMTVRHLKNQQKLREQTITIDQHQSSLIHKYRSGFNEGISEASRFIAQSDTIEVSAKQCLITYLANLILMPNIKSTTSLASANILDESDYLMKTSLTTTSAPAPAPCSQKISTTQSPVLIPISLLNAPVGGNAVPTAMLPQAPSQPQASVTPQTKIHLQSQQTFAPQKTESLNLCPGDVNNNMNSRGHGLSTSSQMSSPASTLTNVTSTASASTAIHNSNTAISLVLPKPVSYSNQINSSHNLLSRENSAFMTVNPRHVKPSTAVVSPNESSPTSTNQCEDYFNNQQFSNSETSQLNNLNSSLNNSRSSELSSSHGNLSSLSSSSSSSSSTQSSLSSSGTSVLSNTVNDQHSQVSSSTNLSPESTINYHKDQFSGLPQLRNDRMHSNLFLNHQNNENNYNSLKRKRISDLSDNKNINGDNICNKKVKKITMSLPHSPLFSETHNFSKTLTSIQTNSIENSSFQSVPIKVESEITQTSTSANSSFLSNYQTSATANEQRLIANHDDFNDKDICANNMWRPW